MKYGNKHTLWRLPDGMQELLPQQAQALEWLRRTVYDLHISWGYQPVEPPVVEFLDSLLSGTGRDFERQTFKIADPLSGRMMGLRADMTPQVARIDAHQLDNTDVARLFYIGTVVRAHTDGIEKNRAPLQIGAEIFGHSGPQSDVEVIRLMVAALQCAGIEDIHLDLGHVGVFRSICEQIELTDADQAELFELLQRKAVTDIQIFADRVGLAGEVCNLLCKLCLMNGDNAALQRAKSELANGTLSVDDKHMSAALQELETISEALQDLPDSISIHFDLAEIRGYQYHTGVVFAAYTPGVGSEIARGGRYDGIGENFGRSRPATGYSTDLKLLMRLIGYDRQADSRGIPDSQRRGILCPDDACPELQKTVAQLRSQGEIVAFDLTGFDQSRCDRVLQKKAGGWSVEKL